MSGKDNNFNIMLTSDAVYRVAMDIALNSDSISKHNEINIIMRFAYLIGVIAATESRYTEIEGMKESVAPILNLYKERPTTIRAVDMIETEVKLGKVADWVVKNGLPSTHKAEEAVL